MLLQKNSRSGCGPGVRSKRMHRQGKALAPGSRIPGEACSRFDWLNSASSSWLLASCNLQAARSEELIASGSLTRNDRGLDVPVAVHHVFQDLLQARERSLAGNVVGRADLLFRDQGEGLAHAIRRVVERRFERDL